MELHPVSLGADPEHQNKETSPTLRRQPLVIAISMGLLEEVEKTVSTTVGITVRDDSKNAGTSADIRADTVQPPLPHNQAPPI